MLQMAYTPSHARMQVRFGVDALPRCQPLRSEVFCFVMTIFNADAAQYSPAGFAPAVALSEHRPGKRGGRSPKERSMRRIKRSKR